ncbi:unnamed protein product [Ostreobium quekettii]|uniref:GRF-type domain-containing protein n=1 Tax=Ostreobium quekettii TaxID=121088 RepID=A0A8S1J5N5_9CHLO|nr:unnamed protein product [Ostreobium quekettii]
MTGARANNYGSRIDMILAAQGVGEASFIERLVHCDIWPEMEGSDHAPVFVDMELLQPLSCRLTIPPPAVSSRALFAAKQRQLDSWLGACNVQKGAAQRQAEDSRVCAAPRRDKPAGATVDGRDCQDMIGCNDACGRGQGSGKSEAAVKRTMGHSILGTAVPAKKRREQRDVREFFNAKPLVKEGTPRITSTGKDRLPKPSDDAKEQPGLQNKGTELQKGTSAKAASPSHCPAHLRGSPVRDSSNLPEEWIKRAESVAAWERINRMLQPPRCQGHGEPCVIREVKKQCANKGRLFFVCARPEGHRPKGRCNHFEWAAKRSYRG